MSCGVLDCDQSFTVHDFGPRGYAGPVTLSLYNSLKPGATISAVALTDHEWNFAVYDEKKNLLFGFQARLNTNILACNSRQDTVWGEELHTDKHTWKKGVRASFCFISDVDGYRVYVNGESVFFYKYRLTGRPTTVEISNGVQYKIIYQTTMNIIP